MSRIKIVKSTKQYLPNFYYFILVLLILFIIFYYFYVSSEKRDLFTIIGVSIAIFAFIINTYNLIINSRQFKLKNTFDFLQRYDKIFIPDDNPKLLQSKGISQDKIIETALKSISHENYMSIRETFNYFEDLSIAIQHNYIYENVAFQSLRHALISNYSFYNIWINNKHIEDKFIYTEVEILYNSWKDGKSIFGKKFYA